jgi:hypothetical protein
MNCLPASIVCLIGANKAYGTENDAYSGLHIPKILIPPHPKCDSIP